MSATDITGQGSEPTGVSGTGGSVSLFSSTGNATDHPPAATMSSQTLTALTRLYGCIGITCLLLGLALNGLVLGFFYSRRKTVSNTLYCVIVAVDLVVSALMLPYILPHFSATRTPLLFTSPDFCKLWTVVWGAASKTTVVLVTVLGIYRTILLMAPLNTTIRALKRRHFLGAMSLYLLVLVVCETVPMWWGYRWYFDQLRMRCEWYAQPQCDERCDRVRTFGYVWNSVTLALPVVPMLGSAVLSVYGLKRGEKGEDRGKNYASMTIVLFTLLYVVLNIPTLVYWIMMLAHWTSGYTSSLLKFDHPYYFYSNFVEILSVALNSLFNPVLYLLRMRELRKYLSPEFEVWRGLPQLATASTIQSTNSTAASKQHKMTSVSGNRSLGKGKGEKDVPMVNMNH